MRRECEAGDADEGVSRNMAASQAGEASAKILELGHRELFAAVVRPPIFCALYVCGGSGLRVASKWR